MLLDPVDLRVPPLDIGAAAFSSESCDVAGNGRGDRSNDLLISWHAVGVAEHADPTTLLGRVVAVGAYVQPEEERVAKVVVTCSRCRIVEVDQRDRNTGAEDGVARGQVVMADDLEAFCKRRFCGRVMETAGQTSGSLERCVAEAGIELVGYLALEVAEISRPCSSTPR